MNICIIRADHLGDLVLTTPLMRELHQAGHQVDVLCRAAHLPALDRLPFIHHAQALETISPGFSSRWSDLAAWLRNRKYDRLLLPYAKPKELLFAARMSGSHLTCMWGGIWSRLLLCRSLRSHLLHHPRHMADIWLDLARDLGCNPQSYLPDLHVSEDEKRSAAQWLQDRGIQVPFIILHPGCGGNACNLPAAEYAELAGLIRHEHRCGIVVSGSGAEKIKFGTIFADVSIGGDAVDAFGELELRPFMSVIALSDCLVSASTGPLHLAAALGTPTVTPFCRRIGFSAKVWGNQSDTGIAVEPDEAWCAARAKQAGHCDFGGALTVQQIADGVSLALSR
jgi:ADP-heptose:LPS heptosyltransferase